jgi:outer membrane protein insertion porin family
MRRIWLVPLILLLQIAVCSGGENDIHKITVLGNTKVEEGVIRGAIKSREGGPFSIDQVREDLRSIFATGFFADIQVDIKSTPGGKEVLFVVVEKPSIKEIVITGNQKLKLEDIKEKMTLALRSILNLEKVKENVEQIRKLYFSKGYYGVAIEQQVDYLETNEAVVRFQITEGPKGRVKTIAFKGNRKIKSSDLKKVMQTRGWNIFSILTKSGILDEDILKNDIQILTAYYLDHGFLDVKVSEPKIDLRNPKRIRIEIEVTEGPQYRIGTIDFKGDLLTTREDLFKSIKIKRHDIYSNSAIRRDINALTEKFANQGYAYVEISPETSVDSKNFIVNLVFDIDKKKRVFFERIQITGNSKTRDKVVRRELQVAEGELYSATKLSRSRDRLKRTGYFKEVDMTSSRGSAEDKMNLEVKVEEAPTGAISFGLGYSTIEQVVGVATVSDRNLFGLGYQGSLRFKLGAETRDFRLGLTDPYFLGSPYTAGIDLYHEDVEIFDTYSYKTLGGDLRFGKELTDKLRADAMYKLERVTVFDVDRTQASRFILEQEGRRITSALSLGFTHDTRDEYFAPSRGAKHTLFIQNAGGILGGDNYFVKVIGETSWFFPAPLKTVLNLRGKIGFAEPYGGKTDVVQLIGLPANPNVRIPVTVRANRKVPIYEKFFVGGLGSVRGFEYGMAGPIDENRDPLGGDKMVVFTSELVFPLAREIGLRGAFFFDIGKGFDHFSDMFPLRTGAGFGIRWFSPFGPIHIDIGFNLSPKDGEKGRVIDFTAGTVF